MGTGYNAMVFLPDYETLYVEKVNAMLEQVLTVCSPSKVELNVWPGKTELNSCDVFTASWQNWQLHLSLNTQSHVEEENLELAGYLKNEPPYNCVAHLKRRIELWTDVDVNAEHFNDYVAVLQAMESQFDNVILLDNNGSII